MLRAVYAEITRRKQLNAAHGVGSTRELPDPPPHLLVLIDEFTSLVGRDPVPPRTDDPELDAERDLIEAANHARIEIGVFAGKIAREARSAGVTLALGTQKLSAKMLDTIPGAGDLKVNLSRVLLGKTSWGDRASALRAPDDAPDLDGDIPRGRGLWETTAHPAQVIQCWYASQAEFRAELEARVPAVPEAERLSLPPPPAASWPRSAEQVPDLVELGDFAQPHRSRGRRADSPVRPATAGRRVPRSGQASCRPDPRPVRMTQQSVRISRRVRVPAAAPIACGPGGFRPALTAG